MKRDVAIGAALLLCALMASPAAAQTAVGRWRSCLDYSRGTHVAWAGNSVYVSTNGGLFRYGLPDRTLNTYSKGDGLNDVGIATMAYDHATGTLVVAYNNSNVDLIADGMTHNLSDIKRSDLAGNKSIYHVRFAHGNAYLATGFGVVVVDLERMEIRETWPMSADGNPTPVFDLAFGPDSIYAATAEGLKRLPATERHPAIGNRWENDARLGDATIAELAMAGSHLLATAYSNKPDDSRLCTLLPGGVQELLAGAVRSVRVQGDKVAVSLGDNIYIYDTALTFVAMHDSYTWGLLQPLDAEVGDDNTLWVGHPWEGLVAIHPDGSDETIHPSGPLSADHCYRLVPFNYRMMLCPGGHTNTYAKSYTEPSLWTAQGRGWSNVDRGSGVLDSVTDVVDVAVNPYDTTEMVAALWGHGLLTIRNNKAQTIYNSANTGGALLPYTTGGYTTLLTGAVAFDRQGELWVLNSHSTHALAVRHRNGTWQSFSTQALAAVPEVDKLVCDSINGYKWFAGRSNVIYVHDGKERMARVDPNHGSKLHTDAVTAIAQDQSGSLWIGTNKGIKVIYDGYRAFQGGGNGEVSAVSCSNITITNGEFAEYLMAYESITAIAVDGANRKWIGTENGGLYLISANGQTQLEHFTANNSPLFSDKIVAIGINERTGEVYIGSDRGLQVYRGTATYAVSQPLDDIHAFPNPVRPGYDGPIAIKGFTRNALVHITDAAGHTVFTTTANGGQAIWNGRNLKGEKVASGVYYVFASDDQGDNRSVAKVLIIR